MMFLNYNMYRSILFFLSVSLFALGDCDYHDCTPTVTQNTNTLKNNIDTAFSKVEEQRKELYSNYNNFRIKLEKNNELYTKLIKLNADILLTLENIKQTRQQSNKIRALDNE